MYYKLRKFLRTTSMQMYMFIFTNSTNKSNTCSLVFVEDLKSNVLVLNVS